MKYYENLSADLSTFFEAINTERAKNVAEANIIADEARVLIARAATNLAKHEELSAIVGAVQETIATEKSNLEKIVGNVRDALKDLYESELPECPVEQFAGYCEVCGESVIEGTQHYSAEGDLLCPLCDMPEEEEAEEAEAEAEAE